MEATTQPPTTLQCIRYLRNEPVFSGDPTLKGLRHPAISCRVPSREKVTYFVSHGCGLSCSLSSARRTRALPLVQEIIGGVYQRLGCNQMYKQTERNLGVCEIHCRSDGSRFHELLHTLKSFATYRRTAMSREAARPSRRNIHCPLHKHVCIG